MINSLTTTYMNVHCRTLFLLVVAYFSVPLTHGQTAAASGWTPYFENEQISIELCQAHRADSVNDIYNNYLLIRLTNKTQTRVHVSFDKQLEYNQEPVSSDKPTDFILLPMQVLEGSVDPATDRSLRVFTNQYHDGKNKKVLTNYALIHIQSTLIPD